MCPKLAGLPGFWFTSQENLNRVFRWKNFTKNGARRQDTLQHSHSIAAVSIVLLRRLAQHNPDLDKGLVLEALTVHDHGEGLVGYDTLFNDKTSEKDATEYAAFADSIYDMAANDQLHLKRVFLLQFCLGSHAPFPQEARSIMALLAEEKRLEALVFDGIECFDYMLYALMEHHNGVAGILAHTVDNNRGRLNELREKIPGFQEEIWTRVLERHIMEELR